jgi:anti-sigma B factor antagonist
LESVAFQNGKRRFPKPFKLKSPDMKSGHFLTTRTQMRQKITKNLSDLSVYVVKKSSWKTLIASEANTAKICQDLIYKDTARKGEKSYRGRFSMVTISEHDAGNVVILNVTGKLMGSENYNALSKKVTELIEQGHALFVLNLNDVANADSTGIGELIVCLKRVKEKGGELKLASPSQKLESLLRITNLERIFDIHPSERSALRSFGH